MNFFNPKMRTLQKKRNRKRKKLRKRRRRRRRSGNLSPRSYWIRVSHSKHPLHIPSARRLCNNSLLQQIGRIPNVAYANAHPYYPLFSTVPKEQSIHTA
jgi:hypothetical protein